MQFDTQVNEWVKVGKIMSGVYAEQMDCCEQVFSVAILLIGLGGRLEGGDHSGASAKPA
jgi:hypothetical protein